jgi:hypothetical protein
MISTASLKLRKKPIWRGFSAFRSSPAKARRQRQDARFRCVLRDVQISALKLVTPTYWHRPAFPFCISCDGNARLLRRSSGASGAARKGQSACKNSPIDYTSVALNGLSFARLSYKKTH